METRPASERTTIRRLPKRAAYDRAMIDAILDEALHCHLGFAVDGQPYVIPTIHARVADRVYVHGSAASRMLRTLAGAVPACLTVTLVDGLVLARSAFHHSMNYRSVVVLGTAQAVVEPAEKVAALHAIVEHVVPGRWDDVRPPNERELKATSVLCLPLTEASAKVRTGGPLDDEEDLGLPCWAGVLPFSAVPGAPVPDEHVAPGTPAPACVTGYRRPRYTA
ncbi:MAG TPA: pyridoxamine 5'-phosphate oxidase family protein [Candidatus Binatia bacterium]|nr:pyridoxamine 5'-phosphate oxidase family protein [Candidatus Binatia bacterium]